MRLRVYVVRDLQLALSATCRTSQSGLFVNVSHRTLFFSSGESTTFSFHSDASFESSSFATSSNPVLAIHRCRVSLRGIYFPFLRGPLDRHRIPIRFFLSGRSLHFTEFRNFHDSRRNRRYLSQIHHPQLSIGRNRAYADRYKLQGRFSNSRSVSEQRTRSPLLSPLPPPRPPIELDIAASNDLPPWILTAFSTLSHRYLGGR